MKKYLMMFYAVMLSFCSMEQAGAVVWDPTNGANISQMLTVISKLNKTTESALANAQFLQNAIKAGPEVKRLLGLLDAMVCATDEMSIFIGVAGEMQLCENKINLNITLAKIDNVSSRLELIASGAMVLSQYEAINSLKTLNDELESAVSAVNSINAFTREIAKRRIRYDYETQNAYDNTAFGTTFNVN